ncbi:universal stress protein [Halobacillus yeomjeoni]|uniref:Universal stress protein n=1 Tax=Halobacillus yeomjeoni TaxID=311194 RepID=A0A931HXQ6_9BACI|nr:universal stress protein [Halobacillus yeomjeoni]MBH0231354.1 universal stress protein [Halobacillus yeomjeoni]
MTVKILVAYDGSECSQRALWEVKNQAPHAEDKEVHIVQVASPDGPSTFAAVSNEIAKEMAATMEEGMEDIKRELAEEDFRVLTKVLAGKGNPGESICKYAEEQDMDLIIIGNRSLGNVKRLFLGSVSNNVVQNATCPVLVMK